MKRLKQELDTSDDSFTYTILGEAEAIFRVDSSGYLDEKGKQIGKFNLGPDEQWHLRIGEKVFMIGPKNGLFYLPEFELKALTELVNLESLK